MGVVAYEHRVIDGGDPANPRTGHRNEAPCWCLVEHGDGKSPVREDMIDYPTGWLIQREGLEHTDPKCSAVQGNGAFLCDCGSVFAEYDRRVARQKEKHP